MSILDKVKTGKISKPLRIMIVGVAGVGKSTFAAGAPAPLFLDAEQRTEHLDIPRIIPREWNDVLGTMRELYKLANEGKASYKTLVIDTLDSVEMLLWAHVCKKHGWNSIEEPGYGKGYVVAQEEWRQFTIGVESLRDVGINVILIAHVELRTFSNPEGENYDKWGIKLNKRASGLVVSLMDAVGFAKFEDLSNKKKGELKAKAATTGERVVCFNHSPAFDSKPGLGLPDQIPLDFKSFMENIR